MNGESKVTSTEPAGKSASTEPSSKLASQIEGPEPAGKLASKSASTEPSSKLASQIEGTEPSSQPAGKPKSKWHVVYVRYMAAEKMAGSLDAVGMESFVPPVVTNLLFVHACKEAIDDFMTRKDDGRRLSYMWDKATRQPVVVSDQAMQTFMTLCRERQCPIIMTEEPTVKLGDRVRIKEGPLAGVEGNVVRMRKSHRVLINIDNSLWVATGFIRPALLEVIG